MHFLRFSHPFFTEGDCLLLAGDTESVKHLHLFRATQTVEENWREDNALYKDVKAWIIAFLDGRRPVLADFTVPKGSAFQQACWQEMLHIPYGETLTYSELAHRAGNPTAIRAAANACARNPMPLIIPCHRVVEKSGGLGGFAWGVNYKRVLLALESQGAR
jgi:O-6-methylguanine DNA methyltransferase